LQAFLSRSLPFYMVPAVFVKMDAIPVNTNGKYDRKALVRPVGGGGGGVTQAETP
jgi:acyl-CoA synthetase (AMP-forming)/AMP-acid ligase II